MTILCIEDDEVAAVTSLRRHCSLGVNASLFKRTIEKVNPFQFDNKINVWYTTITANKEEIMEVNKDEIKEKKLFQSPDSDCCIV